MNAAAVFGSMDFNHMFHDIIHFKIDILHMMSYNILKKEWRFMS